MADFLGLMKQARELQSKMQEMQAKLEALQVAGRAGAGLVALRLNGKGALTALDIDPSLLVPAEAGILVDLILAAHADAKAKLEAELAERMKELTGGLPLPPGLGLGG
jgi:hypothetical protein